MAASRAGRRAVQRRTVPRRSPVRIVGTVIGAFFLAIGVLGFVPAVTTHSDALQLAGFESGARLLGALPVSVLYNVVHVLFGLAGLAMSRTVLGARAYLIAGGALYVALRWYGVIVGRDGGHGLLSLADPDGVLYLSLGAAMLLAGALTPRGHDPTR